MPRDVSVQRFDSYGYMPSPEGKNMRYADHARIVAEMEQAHAAALAAAVAAARAEVVTVELVGDYATGYNAGLIEGDAKGRREGKRLAEAAAAPRTLTADDPEPAVGSVVLDANGSAWQRDRFIEPNAWALAGLGRPAMEWEWVTHWGPVTLIHDGGAA